MAKSSITDKPISKDGKDLLGIETYSKILADFISNSDTPLTIGLQGEWGTGKTSLMNLIERELDNYKSNQICVWINTWEYSLFSNKHIVTPNILNGVFENLKQALDTHVKSGINTEQVKFAFKKVGAFIANAAVTKLTGYNPGITAEPAELDDITSIKKAKSVLADLIINEIIAKTDIKTIVFFIDDLDRLDPTNAVEVLEAIKNLFDFEKCVFVLAIDYDVVVKGLESKFGPKTQENEREFRSFFDKIIQVPFSMPINKYEIEDFLKDKLAELRIDISEDYLLEYQNIVSFTVGFIPRNIKRYLNSYALLLRILEVERKTDSNSEVESFSSTLNLAVFALVGIQMSYPKIFRLLIKQVDFEQWGDESFKSQFDIDTSKPIKIKSTYFDEDWEKFLYLFCQKDLYLKTRAENISKCLNLLRTKIKGDKKNGYFANILSDAMKFAAITSVDDDLESNESKYSKSNLDNLQNIKRFLVNERNYNDSTPTILILEKLEEVLVKEFNKVEGFNINYTKSTLSFRIWKSVFVQAFHNQSKSKLKVKLNFGNLLNREDIKNQYYNQNFKLFGSNDFQFEIDITV